MDKKYSIPILVLVIIVSGILYLINTQGPQQKNTEGDIPHSQISPVVSSNGEELPMTLSGVLVKHGWTKTSESYCAGGGDYFTLKINNDELVLEFLPIYSEAQISNFVGTTITVTGRKENKEIECLPGEQCPVTPDNIFTCEVFVVEKI